MIRAYLYRAHYKTLSGRRRKMTFAAPDSIAAHRIASDWELADDRLYMVQALRPLAVQLELMGAA